MEPASYDFTIHQGTTWSREMTLKDDQDVVIDLSSYQVRLTLRSSYGGPTILALSTGGSGIVVASISPNILPTITPAQSAALTFSFAVYDMEMESPGGVIDRVIYGRVTLRKETTT